MFKIVESKFLLTVPNVLTASRNEKLLLHVFDNPLNSNFKIKLVDPNDNSELQSVTLFNAAPILHTVDLAVPGTHLSLAKIQVEFDANRTKSADIKIRKSDSMVFVETDRPNYKPGELVRFRILHLQRLLKPVTQPIKRVWIESVAKKIMAQWKNVETRNGLAQLEMQLSREPVQGTWWIKVEASDSSEMVQKSFDVKKYVLPKFEVVLVPPTYITAQSNKTHTWRVCAKYSFGQPVQGNATLTFKFWKHDKCHQTSFYAETDPPTAPCPDFGKPTASKTLRKRDGCEEFELDRKYFEDDYIQAIDTTAQVEERGTNVVRNASNSARLKKRRESLVLDFKGVPEIIYPYLSYEGKIQLRYHDGRPASNKTVEVTVQLNRNNIKTEGSVTDAEGFVYVSLPATISISNYDSIIISAKAVDAYGVEDRRRLNLVPWVSPSDSYIKIKVDLIKPLSCDAKTVLPIFFASRANVSSVEVFYLLQNRGGIVAKGQRTVELGENRLPKLRELGVKQGHWDLKLDVDSSFMPESKLIVYFELHKREIVASSADLKFEVCLKHKVRSNFEEQHARPGETVTLSLNTSSDALCGISGVDRSITFLDNKDRTIDPEQVFQSLNKYAARPRVRFWDYSVEECDWNAIRSSNQMRRSDRNTNLRDRLHEFGNAKRAFADTAMIVLSNVDHDLKACPEGGFKSQCEICPGGYTATYGVENDFTFEPDEFICEYGMESDDNELMRALQKETVEMRSEFPETWLWQLVEVKGAEGNLMEVRTPHTITDWVLNTVCVSESEGVGFAPETSLRVTKPYFMDFTLPYSVKQGELLPLKVSLFNYLDHAIPIKLRFGEFTGGDLASEATFTSCLGARDSLVHTFVLDVKVLGDHNITVTAHLNSVDKTCGPEIVELMNDGVIKTIKVKPEGYPVEITESQFICLAEKGEAATMSWHLPVPENAIPGSARGDIAVIGDVMGPSMENLDNLLELPTGCGEQNMVLFVPNIAVLNYLNASGLAAPTLRAKALTNMATGYQRQLNYRHYDGSYSAFGQRSYFIDGSLWLTAFVVKTFAQANEFTFVDDKDLDVSIEWLKQQQLENGCFPQVGTVFNKEMKGGLSESASGSKSLTAYTLIALLETKKPLGEGFLEKALSCLSSRHEANLYATVLTTYAMQLVNERVSTVMVRSAAHTHLQELVRRATTGVEGEIFWQKEQGTPNMALNIEMTAYAIMSLVKTGGEENMALALNAVKWISKQRNSRGGFVSTQDTVVALEALSKFTSVIPLSQVEMQLTATTDDSNEVIKFRINDENRQVLHERSISRLPTNLHWTVTGFGCSLVQSTLRYNLMKTAEKKAAFSLSSNVTSVVPGVCSELFVKVTLSYNVENDVSNMAVLEVEMLSGYEPEKSTLNELKYKYGLYMKRWDFNVGRLSLYFDRIDHGAKKRFGFVVSQKVLVAEVKPAQMKLYDYYEQESFARKEYGIEKLGCVKRTTANF